MADIKALTETAKELIAAPSCYAPLKDAAQAWLDAVGTDRQGAKADKLVELLEDSVTTIDGLLDFAVSDHARALFGDKGAADLLAHAKDIKAKGAKYCDCGACVAALFLLENKDALRG